MVEDLWAAPTATGPVHAHVRVPGSKSATNRALVLAALADGPSLIREALDARDTRLMIDALGALGATFTVSPQSPVGNIDITCSPVPPAESADRRPAVGIDVGLAGTVMRFVPAVAALVDADVRFDGDEGARTRPMSTITGALRSLGVIIEGGDTLPFTVRGAGQVAGGANVLCFTTGRGSVFGCKPTPSLKLATNTALYRRMTDDMDINCGTIVDGEETIQENGKRIFELILATASGQKTKSEALGIGDDEFEPWKIGATM